MCDLIERFINEIIEVGKRNLRLDPAPTIRADSREADE